MEIKYLCLGQMGPWLTETDRQRPEKERCVGCDDPGVAVLFPSCCV